MLRASTLLSLALSLVACAGPVADASTTTTTSETSSGPGTTGTSGDGPTPTEGSTEPALTTTDASGSTTHAGTSGLTSSESTGSTSTGGETTQAATETGDEDPFRVGIALKSLCSPDLTSICGITPDDRMVCWGGVDNPYYQVPTDKVKAVGPHCFTPVLENGELHRLKDFPMQPVALPAGPFVLAGGGYPYGCAMAANNEMTCWAAEGYPMLEDPPPGPYLALDDARESNCQMCGIRGDGSLVCWKKPVGGNWYQLCDGVDWVGAAPGTYTKFIDSSFEDVRVMNDAGQLIWFYPSGNEKIYVAPLFESGGFVEARVLLGLKQSGDLLYYEEGMGDGVPVLPGAYTTFWGDQHGGCAIRQADSRVVCWGEGDYGQFDPPTD